MAGTATLWKEKSTFLEFAPDSIVIVLCSSFSLQEEKTRVLFLPTGLWKQLSKKTDIG